MEIASSPSLLTVPYSPRNRLVTSGRLSSCPNHQGHSRGAMHGTHYIEANIVSPVGTCNSMGRSIFGSAGVRKRAKHNVQSERNRQRSVYLRMSWVRLGI